MDRQERTELLIQTLNRRILTLDGAMGTAIQSRNLGPQDFGGADYEGCNEFLISTRPDLIAEIHKEYLAAGCDIIETNTFGATPLVLAEYGLEHRAHEINFNAAQTARKAAENYSSEKKPRFVAGAMGPTTKAISVTGGISFEALQEHFYIQAKGLFEGGADYLLLETCQDTRNIKAALLGIDKVFNEKGEKIPIAVSGTIEPTGTMLAGQSIEALLTSLMHRDLLYIGLNCATGPEFMTDPIRSLAKLSPFRVACVPNAGLPDENGRYLETPQMISAVMERFIQNGWINLVGGCCGTHSEHITELVTIAARHRPRALIEGRSSWLSGVDFLEVADEVRPVIVGERTNVIGSKKFKTLICENKFDEASEVARTQVKAGAQVIDICVANPDRDELQDMRMFMEIAIKKIRAPLMIDSTDEKVIAAALTYCQGKAIINSINLEDGEERFKKILPMAKQFGAALIVGTIDDDPIQGMGISRDRKLAIAERSYRLLVDCYGIPPQDIYWDPLVFPCATGDAKYTGSAVETIEAIRLIKQKFPGTRTVLGISNVSFGLPASGREVLNSVFLYQCVQAGLDLAIVNSEKLIRYASISEEEKKLSEDLLYNRVGKGGTDPISAFAAHFRTKIAVQKAVKEKLPLLERLAQYIIEGVKDGLSDDLNEALQTMQPLEIINGPLMKGMDEVGRLFNENQLIVAEVLQSAEAMKAAVAHLEPYLKKTDAQTRGKVLLATVKGDVHDIGKNLVEIILTNNGFKVVNLGIKVPPAELIKAIREHEPDIVGLSGLLVKSAQQMAVTADDLGKAGISTPIMVGGAALSSNFVDKQIAKAYPGTVAYASDAMKGLALAKMIVSPESFKKLQAELSARREKLATETPRTAEISIQSVDIRSSQVPVLATIPSPPDFDRHVLKNTPLEQIWRFINPLMLYGRHLGIKGAVVRQLSEAALDPAQKKNLQETSPKAYAIWRAVEEVKQEYCGAEVMAPAAVFQFFRACGDGNKVVIKNAEKEIVFDFPRQRKQDGLCLADYLGKNDSTALFVVTAGQGVRRLAELLKNRGDYLKSHIVQALALETAEGYAELLHSQLRKAWGFPDPIGMTMLERFQAKYRGKRYSFGYPACPKLDDQSLLFEILKPQEMGVQLTDGFMMDPEASVSAIVFHHPDASYFSVGHKGGDSDDNR